MSERDDFGLFGIEKPKNIITLVVGGAIVAGAIAAAPMFKRMMEDQEQDDAGEIRNSEIPEEFGSLED